jgi:hypothetical protein
LNILLGVAMAGTLPPLDWKVVNDTVMGGVSTGSVARTPAGTTRFTGDLSLEQNGGFVSIRAPLPDRALADAAAVRVTLRGQGRTWGVNLYRRDVPLRAGAFRKRIETDEDGTTTITIPLADFSPTSFGRPVDGAPALDAAPDRITGIGFLLADGQPGPFTFEVVDIAATGERRPRGPGHADVATTLRAAIAAGVPQFNAGDVTGCRERYQAALEAVRTRDALTDGEQRIVRDALTTAADQDPREAAWTHRHAIDTVLASAPR